LKPAVMDTETLLMTGRETCFKIEKLKKELQSKTVLHSGKQFFLLSDTGIRRIVSYLILGRRMTGRTARKMWNSYGNA
jgi:hypothetical protein